VAAKHVKVKPVDCEPDEVIARNIIHNCQMIKNWLGPCKTHDMQAWLFSAGPSLDFATKEMFPKKYFDGLPRDSYRIFCIKHALPALKEAGVIPDFCVALDPREIKGTSTHGKPREELYAAAPKETTMLIASMTHPSVTKYLLDRGYKVVGWHAASGALNSLLEQGIMKQCIQLDGGTSSAMRTLSIAHHLGFREANLVGFDCSLEGEPKENELQPSDKPGGPERYKYFEVKNPKDKRDQFEFWASGELVAQAQDIEAALANAKLADLELRFYGLDPENSYGGNVVEHTKNLTKFPLYEERFPNV